MAADMTSLAKALEPCPFCGETIGLDFAEGSTFRWLVASCKACGATAGEERVQTMGDGEPKQWWEEAKTRAIESWNRRAAAQDAERYRHLRKVGAGVEIWEDGLIDVWCANEALDKLVDEQMALPPRVELDDAALEAKPEGE